MLSKFKPGRSVLQSFRSLRRGFGRPARGRALVEADLDTLCRRIILPSVPVTDEETARVAHQDQGQKLARQEKWEELSQLVRLADDVRLATPGGEPQAMLLAFGARSDVVAAAEDALHDGQPPKPDGIAALEEMRADHDGDYPCALVVALAHVDVALAWRAAAPNAAGEDGTAQARHHLARARDLLAPHDGVALDAPSLVAAQCALAEARPDTRRTLTEGYEQLIDLAPESPRHMRALGAHMLSFEAETRYPDLEVEARRTAARTQACWGAGGYTWVYLDALARDRQAAAMLDCAFFMDGMQDILTRRPNQHLTNVLAAFCAVTMAPDPDRRMGRAAAVCARLNDCADWILADHLQELHPLIWSQAQLSPGVATPLPSRRALVTRGRQTALQVIAERFAEDIADGGTIAFSPSGMYRLPAV